jgi:hypothetical protein
MMYPDGLEAIGLAVPASRRVPGPPTPPYEVGVGYPLAFDVRGRIAAVSFAALDVYGHRTRVVVPGRAVLVWCRRVGLCRRRARQHDEPDPVRASDRRREQRARLA